MALVDFSDQTTKIYHQGASVAQLTFEQPCGGYHAFEHRNEMRRDRIWGRYYSADRKFLQSMQLASITFVSNMDASH